MRNLVAIQAEAGTSKILRVNGQQMNFKLGLFTQVSDDADLTYSVEYTYDQPEDDYPTSYAVDADWREVDDMSALIADGVGNIFYKVNAVRLNVTAYTAGSVKLTVTQSF